MVDRSLQDRVLEVGYHCLVGSTPDGIQPKAFRYKREPYYQPLGLVRFPPITLGWFVPLREQDVILSWSKDHQQIRDDRFLEFDPHKGYTASLRQGPAYLLGDMILNEGSILWEPLYATPDGGLIRQETADPVYATVLEFPDSRFGKKEVTQYTVFLPSSLHGELWTAFEEGKGALLMDCYNAAFPQDQLSRVDFHSISRYLPIATRRDETAALHILRHVS